MITGRQEQLDRIVQAIAAIASGTEAPNVLFVTGEAGIGKTTLLREAEQQIRRGALDDRTLARFTDADSRSPIVAFAQCSTPLAGRDIGEVESLNPWADIMARLLELSAQDVVSKKKPKFDFAKFFVDTAPAWVTMVPILGPSVGAALEIVGATYDQYYFNRKFAGESAAAQNAANQQQVFQQYINFLRKASEQHLLVLVIDDFHWADTSSTNLLFAAARELRDRPVLFLIAYRPDDAAGSRGGEGHPILHIRNELQRYGLALDIDVPRFTTRDLGVLLHSRYPGYTTNQRFEEWLLHISGGNALFITQFLATLEDDGIIDPATGIVRGGFEHARVPASAQAVVQERIRRLNDDTRELLRYASVEGDVFTAAVLAAITETPQLKLLQKLRLAEQTHQFVRSLGKQRIYAREVSAYTFTHTLLHKVLYDSLGEEERELLHEAVFAVLKEEWETARQERVNLEGTAARLATHAEILGHYLFAAEVLLEGARASWSEFAEEETIRQLQKVSALLQTAGEQTTAEATRTRQLYTDTCILHARVDLLRGRFAETLHYSRKAAATADMLRDTTRYCDAVQLEVEALRSLGEFDAAEQRARELLETGRAEELPKETAAALNELGAIMYLRARYSEALELFRQSLELVPEHDHPTGSRVLNNIGLAESALGMHDSALEFFHRSIDKLRKDNNRVGEATYINNIGLVQYHLGNLEEALKSFQESLALRQSVGDIAGVAASYLNVGLTYLQLGDHDKALAYFEQSLPLARALSYNVLTVRLLLNMGDMEAQRNNVDSAFDYYRSGLDVARAADNREGEILILISTGTLLRRLQRYDECRSTMEEALRLAHELALPECKGVAQAELALLSTLETGREQDRPVVLRTAAGELRQAIALLDSVHSLHRNEWQAILDELEQELATLEAVQR